MMLGTYGRNSNRQQTAAQIRAARLADKRDVLAARLAKMAGAK